MKVEIYCAERSMWVSVLEMLYSIKKLWAVITPERNVAKNPDMHECCFLKYQEHDDNIFIRCYDRRIPFQSDAQVIFMEANCPQSIKAALKVANPLTVPFVFKDIQELEKMWKEYWAGKAVCD